MSLIYSYCVTNKKPDLSGGFYFVHHRGLYAVASTVSEEDFSEEGIKRNLADLGWLKAKAGAHEDVIETVMKNACVIPFKFGTIFNTEENLKEMLEKHAAGIKRNLEVLEGKEEWGVKVYCDTEGMEGNFEGEDEGVLKIEEEIGSSSPGKGYFLKKKKEGLIKELVNRRINEYGKESFVLLKGFSSSCSINKLLPKEVTERGDDMILNSAYLVDKGWRAEFLRAVDALRFKYSDKNVSFDCTGPWPPYNFCNFTKEGDEKLGLTLEKSGMPKEGSVPNFSQSEVVESGLSPNMGGYNGIKPRR